MTESDKTILDALKKLHSTTNEKTLATAAGKLRCKAAILEAADVMKTAMLEGNFLSKEGAKKFITSAPEDMYSVILAGYLTALMNTVE
jgi:hypothetical protein